MRLLVLAVFFILHSSLAAEASTEVAFVRGTLANGSSSWNPGDFGWFYYDLDSGSGGEKLCAETRGRLIESGDLTYLSSAWSEEFEYNPWGRYYSVAFLGKPYFAGYPECLFTDAESCLRKGELRSVLDDDKEPHILSHDDPLLLYDGYVLVVKEVSENGDRINFILLKDKKQVDSAVVSLGDTYVFKNLDGLPLILVHANNAMQEEGGGTVQIDGIFQISEHPTVKFKAGDKLGIMKLEDYSDKGFLFKTDKDLTLTQDSITTLVPGLMLHVANSSNLLYYPEGVFAEYGFLETRGPVFTSSSFVPVFMGGLPGKALAKWNFANFTGFYFDPENGLGSETLTLFTINGREIPVARSEMINGSLIGEGLQYTSFFQPKKFEHNDWGYYLTASFLGQLWFGGYAAETSSNIGHKDLIREQRLGQILIDSEEPNIVAAGSILPLAEGYQFKIEHISEEKVSAKLLKWGQSVDDAVIRSNSTYIYKKDWAEIADFPVIAVHVKNIFDSSAESLATIDGIFQISDRDYSIEPGDTFGELEIVSSSPGIIIMVNPEKIELDTDSSVYIAPGMNIRVADNESIRYYLYTDQHVVPKPRLAGIDYPRNIPSSSQANFTMTVLAGEIKRVGAEIIDPTGRTIYSKDLTPLGTGSEDLWNYFWQWNATVLELSDDGSPVLDASQSHISGWLYLNESMSPIMVGVRFDGSGRIAGILGSSGEFYYISPSDYSSLNPAANYNDMLNNSTERGRYIKIEPVRSLLRFFEYINGTSQLSVSNHTIQGSIGSIEPNANRMEARLGKHEIRLRIENAADTLQVSGLFFNITPPEIRGAILGSGTANAGDEVVIPLQVPLSDREKRVDIVYDPEVISAAGVPGTCASSSGIDPKDGWINVTFPPNCSLANLTFRAGLKNATSDLKIAKVEGFSPDKLINGSITVLSDNKAEKKSSAPGLALALAAFVLASAARRRCRK